MGDVRKFSAWSFLRNVLMQGRDIHLDHVGKGYESYSARVDEAASEREQELERAISARAEVPEGVSRLVDALEGAMIESLHGEGFDLWAKNRGKFRNRLPENVGAIVVKMRALLAAAPQPAGECCDTPACCFRDAYVGAREDLSDWKGRAQRAEAELRRLGYAGIDASVPPSQPAGEDGPSVYVECRLCDTCEHVGINDAHSVAAACLSCEWNGPAPDEDKCPKCGRDGTMAAACPKCSGRYMFMADTEISVQAERALSAQGEAIGWGEIDHGRLVSFTASRTERNTTPLYTHPAPAQATHPDDLAVDRFAVAMKAKLASARAKGRGGWDGPECNADILSRMLRDHVDKGDPRDVANFCMFLHQRGEAILPAPARVTEDVRGLLERALPFLRDEAGKYDDDGSNEPLEIAREIEAALEADHG